jgi:hypothetical protein
MRQIHTIALVFTASVAPIVSASTQLAPRPTLPPIRAVSIASIDDDDRSGPRFGAAYLIGGSVTAERAGRHIAPVTTLFGWQFERQFPTGEPSLPVPMTEFVALAGGMEQGVLLPSASWLLGLRKPNGWEAGVGPTVTGAGLQLAIAGGITRSLGSINVPINVAVAPGRRGAAISITSGFNMKRGP